MLDGLNHLRKNTFMCHIAMSIKPSTIKMYKIELIKNLQV